MNKVKLSFVITILSILMVFVSCNKESYSQKDQNEALKDQIEGKWVSKSPYKGFYEIEFLGRDIKFTIGAGTTSVQIFEWKGYNIENRNILSIYLYDTHYQKNAFFRYKFMFEENGQLRINNIIPSLTQVIGQYPGDISKQGDCWFIRDDEGDNSNENFITSH
ncbi:hypothetical protein ACR782_00700 [Sphingobacterium spiritivorum]|uniref:hypothetical protein n=1 Tax=Sphingobacterium spiritivorum TaxID=258 RepID=UPI003DA2B4B0